MSFQRLEQRGALGEKSVGSDVVEVKAVVEVMVVVEEVRDLKWRGRSLPSEKS